jgi:O-antigen/teichoic acid export membrane protein
MTWLSYSTKALSLFIVLPQVLKEFSPENIILWYLFFTIISLQSIADFGFSQTFSRIISYAFNGAKEIGIYNNRNSNLANSQDEKPNILLLNSIISTMKFIYFRLTIITFFFMGILGTYFMITPINNTSDINGSWISWFIVIIVSCISFYGKIYMNFLEGINKIALVRRVEILTSIGSIVTSIIVLYIAPSLINLVIANQVWVIIVTIRDWYLCNTIYSNLYKRISKKLPFDKLIFIQIWRPAWRNGISGLMSVGLTNLTGLIYAQIGNSIDVASYLLALRIVNQIKDISMAPFYSKIPMLAMLRVKNDLTELIKIVKRGMFISHLVFVVGFIAVGLLSDTLLKLIHSQVQFVSQPLWILLGLAFFAHRFGGMHMQVHMSTNYIITHIVDGITGLIYIAATLILSNYIGVYSIPVGMLIAYLGFFSWYAARHSYSSLQVKFWDFEKSTSLLPISIIFIYVIFRLIQINFNK